MELQCFLGILGGWTGVYGGFTTSAEFVNGAQMDFIPSILRTLS
jgi:phospholipid/cholesterol/gamma-HCH transport system permease protein